MFNVDQLDAFPADGVLTLRINISGQPAIETWIIVRHLDASATPNVSSPAPLAMTKDTNPEVRFAPFRSPELSTFERRTLNVYVENSVTKAKAWNFSTNEPGDTSSVRVGSHANAPKTKLAPGNYWLALTAGEERHFGAITIVRGSQAGVSFTGAP